MKPTAVVVLVLLAAALPIAGCGGGSNTGSTTGAPKKATSPNAPAGSKVVSCGSARLRATVVGCGTARATMEAWESSAGCALGGSSRNSCSLGDFRCQAVKADEGVAVSCAGPKGDVSFIVKPAG